MNNIKADSRKNRLYVTISGKVDVPEISQVAQKVREEVKGLRPGFGVISDITGFIPASEEVRSVMQGAMQYIKETGVGQVVRISSQGAVVVSNQWQRTSRAVGYSAVEASSLAEAERLLDQLSKN